ncbi:glycosyltransferase family 2 protein [Orbaceae bacterium ESL0727]|nr:glycosyltransferase family 2 protein [Orbaceae bacterium ESL0727]
MKISIIIPIYNAEKTIGRLLDCILSQSYSNWELLLINDGSKDNSQMICESFIAKDVRIKLYNQKNSGVSAARNKGIENATGKFITFIDSDDVIQDNYLQGLIDEFLSYNSPDLIIQGFIEEHKKNKHRIREPGNNVCYFLEKNSDFFYSFKLLEYGYPFSKLFLNKIIDTNQLRFNENLTFCEDLVFLLKYIYYCKTIFVSNKTNYMYYFSAGSLSHRIHEFKSEYNSYDHIQLNYKKLLERYNISQQQQQFLLMKNCNMITRPFASIITMTHGSFIYKQQLVNSLEDEYFLILKEHFRTKKQYFYLSIFCNKKYWILLAPFFYIKYKVIPNLFKNK